MGLWSRLLRDLAAVCGAGLIAYGVWQIYEPAGLIVAGLMLGVPACLLARND
jgi:hypothetical protein